MELGTPTGSRGQALLAELDAARTKLNDHVQRMHTPIEVSGWTPYQILGELVRARATGVESDGFQLLGCEQWTLAEMRSRRDMLVDVVKHGEIIGLPTNSPWHGVYAKAILPSELQRLSRRWKELIPRIGELKAAAHELAGSLNCHIEMTPGDIRKIAKLCLHLTSAPEMDRSQMVDDVWESQQKEIGRIVQAGQTWSAVVSVLPDTVADVAWTTDLGPARRHLAAYGHRGFAG